ncbi:MAG: hypothetical protein WCG23_00860 [bacterium]
MFGYDSLFKAIYDALGSDVNLSAIKTNTDNIETRLSNVESDLTTLKIHTPWAELASTGVLIPTNYGKGTINSGSSAMVQPEYVVPAGHVCYVKTVGWATTGFATVRLDIIIDSVTTGIYLGGGTQGSANLDGVIRVPAGGAIRLFINNEAGATISQISSLIAISVAE